MRTIGLVSKIQEVYLKQSTMGLFRHVWGYFATWGNYCKTKCWLGVSITYALFHALWTVSTHIHGKTRLASPTFTDCASKPVFWCCLPWSTANATFWGLMFIVRSSCWRTWLINVWRTSSESYFQFHWHEFGFPLFNFAYLLLQFSIQAKNIFRRRYLCGMRSFVGSVWLNLRWAHDCSK